MAISEKEKKILKEINIDKESLVRDLIKTNILPNDIFKRIENINILINTEMVKIINNEVVDYKNISNFINKLIVEKVYLNKVISSTYFLKWKISHIKSQTKMQTITENFDDGVIQNKSLTGDLTNLKMEWLTSYYNVIQDSLAKIKDTKDLLDTTIISLQSQLKNVTFEYINAWKISN